MDSLFKTLSDRGAVEQCTDPRLGEALTSEQFSVYAGFDPTADSLHLGHLVPIIALSHFQRHGHKVIVLIGGATGMIGDPSGKSEERNLLTPQQVAVNAAAVKRQMSKFIQFDGPNAAMIVDNNEWIAPMSFIDWLREVGKYFTVNYMLAKDSVKQRLERESGISYTEFSYMTMQAYDFLYLFDKYGCKLQCGGNDQWGNITAGIDLIAKRRGVQTYGLTFPLLSTASGQKFGKTAGNAVWLDACRTSPYQFYQYWVRTEDADVERFLKLFTFLDLEEVQAICATHRRNTERREAQKMLASEITRLVHGEEGLARARQASEALFGGDLSGLGETDLLDAFSEVPSTTMPRDVFEKGVNIVDLLVQSRVVGSRSEARRLVAQGGVYVNSVRAHGIEMAVNADRLLAGSILVLRQGKKGYHLVRVQAAC